MLMMLGYRDRKKAPVKFFLDDNSQILSSTAADIFSRGEPMANVDGSNYH